MKRITSARRRVQWRYPDSPPGDPIEFGIKHFAELPRNRLIVLFCRVSTSPQHKNDNLKAQVESCQLIIEKQGNPIVSCHREVAGGWELCPENRPDLLNAVEDAKKFNAAIVVESLDRLIRNAFYHPHKNPFACPTKAEFQKLMRLLQGVTVATICHPNTRRFGKDGIRSLEIKRGQTQKKRSGGRPKKVVAGQKKQRRMEKCPAAVSLRNQGMSIREIAEELEIPKTTVERWLQRGC